MSVTDFKSATNSGDRNYPMRLTLFGTSFRHLAVEEREILSALEKNELGLLENLRTSCGLEEAALVSTCNRFEIISVHEKGENAAHQMKTRLVEFLEKRLGRSLQGGDFYQYDDRAAVRHLFRVTSSLDSMVIGEAQILGQIKSAYRKAVTEGSAGRYLHHLFQFAFRLAKKVRSNTAVADKGVSVSYVAVRLAKQIFGELRDSSVLIIGSGQMAELAAVHLRAYGCGEIIVANRTLERAFELANKIGGSAISLSDIEQQLSRVDMVISSLADVDSPLIEISTLKRIKRLRPLFLLDLGVPRNLTPALGELDDVYLYNIDDLVSISDENKTIREEAASEAEILIDYGLLQFEKWLAKVSAEPTILDFRAKVRAACEEELSDLLKNYLSPEESGQKLTELSHRISQKISHDITNLLSKLPDGKLDQQALLPLLFDEYLKLI